MATLFGKNRAKQDASPAEAIEVNENHGRIRRSYDEIEFSAATSAGDVIKMMYLPKGARIVDAVLVASGGLGAAIELDVGWQAGQHGDENADTDAIFDGVSTNAAFTQKLVATSTSAAPLVGYNHRLSDSVQVVITSVGAGADASGETLSLEVHYVVD